MEPQRPANAVHLERRPGMLGRQLYYRLGPSHEVIPCDVIEFAEALENGSRHVAQTAVAGLLVSTVFLGIDHGWHMGRPVLFESMTFGPDGGGFACVRYRTWDEAVAGHRAIVAQIKRDRWRRPHVWAWRMIRRAHMWAVLYAMRVHWIVKHWRRAG